MNGTMPAIVNMAPGCWDTRDAEGTTWTCVQAFAGLGRAGIERHHERVLRGRAGGTAA